MSKKKIFTLNQAKTIGEQLSIRWDKFDVPQFRAGFGVELEHGTVNQTTNVTNDDPLMTGKIALAHLTEFPDYYTRLAKLEETHERLGDQPGSAAIVWGLSVLARRNVPNGGVRRDGPDLRVPGVHESGQLDSDPEFQLHEPADHFAGCSGRERAVLPNSPVE